MSSMSVIINENTRKHKIFISRFSTDEKLVQGLVNVLIVQCDLDIWDKPTNLSATDNSQKTAIVNGINEAKLVLCFITKNYYKSFDCRQELKIASDLCFKDETNCKKFFIIMLEDVPEMDNDPDLMWHILDKHKVKMYESENIWSGNEYVKLLDTIGSVMGVLSLKKNDLCIGDWSSLDIIDEDSNSILYKTKFQDNRSLMMVKKFNCHPCGEAAKNIYYKELHILHQIKHDNIVKLIGYFDKVDTYIILEHMDGHSLYKYLHGATNKTKLTFEQSVNIIKCILRGINYLHKTVQIVHGSINSRNILLKSNYEIAKLTNFAQSKYISDSTYTHSITTRWTSPEQLLNNMLTSKSDIWSFGLVIGEIVTSEKPFGKIKDLCIINGSHLKSDNDPYDYQNKDEALACIMSACLEKDAESRCNANQLLNLLNEI